MRFRPTHSKTFSNPVILNTISRVDSIHVRFSITEIEYLDLIRWMEANKQQDQPRKKRVLELILADGSLYPHTGTVSFAQRQIDPATGTLQFEASFPNPERQLRPGQFARIRTIFDERENAVVVPAIALIEMQGQYLIYTVDRENKVVLNRVVTGPKFEGNTVIEQGINAGDRVIVEGLQIVRPGMVVSPSDMPPDSLKKVEGS